MLVGVFVSVCYGRHVGNRKMFVVSLVSFLFCLLKVFKLKLLQ